jgi:hypothetical protein
VCALVLNDYRDYNPKAESVRNPGVKYRVLEMQKMITYVSGFNWELPFPETRESTFTMLE